MFAESTPSTRIKDRNHNSSQGSVCRVFALVGTSARDHRWLRGKDGADLDDTTTTKPTTIDVAGRIGDFDG
jgi:hypothetical protein